MSAEEQADAVEAVDEQVEGAPDVPAAEDPSLTGAIEAIEIEAAVEEPETVVAGSDDESAEPAAVPAVTAADIPALAGCDTEAAWESGEPCPDTAVAEAAAGPADADIEPATIPEAVREALDAEKAAAEVREQALELKAARARYTAPTWPFAAYVMVWLLLATIAGYQLAQVEPGQALYETEVYALTVLGGAVLTLAGPVLILAVWLIAKIRTHDASTVGLFSSAILKGSVATLIGVGIWWGTLVLVDYLRLGRPL